MLLADRHADPRNPFEALQGGAQERLAAGLGLFRQRQRGGDHRAAGMGNRGAMEIVNFQDMH